MSLIKVKLTSFVKYINALTNLWNWNNLLIWHLSDLHQWVCIKEFIQFGDTQNLFFGWFGKNRKNNKNSNKYKTIILLSQNTIYKCYGFQYHKIIFSLHT